MFRSSVARSRFYCVNEYAEVRVAEYLEIPIKVHDKDCKNHEGNNQINIAISGIDAEVFCALGVLHDFVLKRIKVENLYEHIRKTCDLMAVFANGSQYVNAVDSVLYQLGVTLEAQLKTVPEIMKQINGFKAHGYALTSAQSKKFQSTAEKVVNEYKRFQKTVSHRYPTFALSIVRSYYDMGDVTEEIEDLPRYCKKLVIIGELLSDWVQQQNKNVQKPNPNIIKSQTRRSMLERASYSAVPEIRERARFLMLQDIPNPQTSFIRSKQSLLKRTSRSRAKSVSTPRLTVPYDILQRVNESNYALTVDELIEKWEELSERIGECFEKKILNALYRSLKTVASIKRTNF